MSQTIPNFIVAGPNKSASTWIYEALSEHPDICMAERDPVNFFDVRYHKGFDWYLSNFDHYDGESAVGDESPGYIKSMHAPKRIAKHNPDASVVFCFRNPIERAYSQWWHGRTRWHHSKFCAGLVDHERFDYWVVPGFYYHHLKQWEEQFPSEQLLPTLFDDFTKDNRTFISEIYEFLEVDPTFEPSIIGESVNTAKGLIPDTIRTGLRNTRNTISRVAPQPLRDALLKPVYYGFRPYFEKSMQALGSKSKYEREMNPEVRRALEQTYEADIRMLQKRIGRALDHWFEYVDLSSTTDTDTPRQS